MTGNRVGYLLKRCDLSLHKIFSWLVVNHTEASEYVARRTIYWDFGIKSKIGPPGDIGFVLETLLLFKVTNNKTGWVCGHITGILQLWYILTGEQSHRMRANAKDQIQGSDAKINAIVWEMYIAVA
ncbi:hypothetical protein F66182_15691 [Fusarium sp. NRRL 66182]|nr:hypothetical protein F66182_15691 [Fusarium sp. NRRL 66182]